MDVQNRRKAYGGELEWTFEDEPKEGGWWGHRGPAIFVDGRVERVGKSGTTTTA